MNVNGPRVGNSVLSSSRLHIARRMGVTCFHAVATILVIEMPLAAEEPKTVPDSGPSYARTPEDVLPYRNFQEPYHRFFQSVSEFRGTGRDDVSSAPPATARIGFLGPVGSAPDSDLGQQMLEGVRMAIEEANAEGGYKGIPFELVVRPDSGLWGASSIEWVAFSYVDNVLAVIGSIDGANTHVALRVTLKTKVPIVNTGGTDPTLTDTNLPWILRCLADDRQQGYALAHHIFRECGITKVAALRVNDRHGRFGIAKFRDAARRLGHPLRVEVRWKRGDRDFSPQLQRIAESGAEAIVLWGNASDAAAVVHAIRQWNETNPSAPLPERVFGCDRLASPTFLAEAGAAAEGVVAIATYDPTRDDPQLTTFVNAFTARFGHEPAAFAAHGYDGASILVAAIRKAGLNRVRIRDALYEYKHFDGVTGPIEFDSTLNDVGPVYLATVQNGRFAYREAKSTSTARADHGPIPYRTLAESPPAVRLSPPPSPNETTPLRLGCFLPLDDAGQAAVRGMQMALENDAAKHPDERPIKLLVRDARGVWGSNSGSLVDLVFQHEILALIGSTERRGTHVAEMLATKVHFPVVSLCGTDPTITEIPLPWIFCVASQTMKIDPDFVRQYRERHETEPDAFAALGFDAAALLAARIRDGADTRIALQNGLAAETWYRGVSGLFRFDKLGNRVEEPAGRQDY
jgi:branched-chain amino acid transport system substrate-binding protein